MTIFNHATAVLLALFAAPVLAELPESMDPALIPNYTIIRPGLAAGGQPTAEGLKQLKAQGFKTVINLRTDAEAGAVEEEAAVAGEGLRYVRVPISPASFGVEDVAAVKRALDDPAAGPVLLHCSTSNRVGAVWAVIQAQQGKGLEEAVAEGRRVGLKSEVMVEAVRRVIEASPKP
jgi:uncharacterized protein (TIGR01244 family)